MTDISAVISLLLFVVSSSFYLFYWVEHQAANFRSVVFKCLPIISLCLLVYSHQSHVDLQFQRGILWSLILSTCADGIFIKPAMWTAVLGTVLFAIAQIVSMMAFGFDPWRWDMLCVSLTAWSAFVFYAIMKARAKTSHLDIGTYIYLFILFGMCWRVAAFCAHIANVSYVCDVLGTTGLIGALSFVLSDLIIVIHIIVVEIPDRTHWVMATYYLAQLGLALTVYRSDFSCLRGEVKETLVQSDNTFITSP